MPAVSPYPVILTAADWNKKKGTIAKVVFPTKLGDALREAEKDYSDVPWANVFGPVGKTLDIIDSQIMKVTTGFTAPYKVFLETLAAAKKQAQTVQAEWGKNKLVPKEAKAHIDLLVKAFDSFHTKLEHDTQTTYQAMKDLRMKVAKNNPDQVAAQKEKMNGGPFIRKPGTQSSGFTGALKIRPGARPPVKPKATESEAVESESDER